MRHNDTTDTYDYKLLSISEAHKMMNISRRSLQNLIEAGKIGVIKIGKQSKVPEMEIRRFFEECTLRAPEKLSNDKTLNTHTMLREPSRKSKDKAPAFNSVELFNNILKGN